jgi:hypothetical protein
MKNQITGSLDNDIIESLELLLSSLMESELTKTQYSLYPPDSGFDHHWFFNAATKSLERFDKGIHVEIIEDYDEDSYLCYYNGSTIIIKKSKIGIKVEH